MEQSKAGNLIGVFAEFFPGAAEIGSYVGGRLVPGTGQEIQLFDPATGEKSISYRDAGAEIAQQACIAAREAQKTWWGLTHAARGRVLYAVAAKVRACNESLALLEAISTGKPIRDSRREVEMVAEMFEFYADWADKLYGHVIPVPTSHLNYTRREPYGTILHIAPWNIPILFAAMLLDKVRFTPAITTNTAAILKLFAKSNLGFTFLTPIAIAPELAAGELVAIPVENRLLQSPEAHLVTRAGRQLSPAANRLVQGLTAQMNKYGQYGAVS